MEHLVGKVIISPRLLMEKGESGKGGLPVRRRGRHFGLAHTYNHIHTHTDINVHNTPTHWHISCTHRKAHLVHTLPMMHPLVPANTHPCFAEDVLL